MRCKHEEVTIHEEAVGYAQHSLQGGFVYHNLTEPGLTGTIVVDCSKCGWTRTYPRSRRPKWVARFLEQLLGHSDCEAWQPFDPAEARGKGERDA